MILFLLF